jgi:hypothetical protein
MGNATKAIVALAAIAGIGYTLYDYSVSGSFWWDKLIAKYRIPPQQNQLQVRVTQQAAELVRVKQELAKLKPPASTSKYSIESLSTSFL